MSDLKHYGTPRRSGRYPWGSGEDPYQSGAPIHQVISALKQQGVSEKDIAKGFGMSINELRQKNSLSRTAERAANRALALKLHDKGMSNVAIGAKLGMNESSVRSLLNDSIAERQTITKTTADILKKNVDEKGYIDVGLGVEHHIGVSRVRLKTAVEALKEEGYEVHWLKVEQMGTGKYTSMMVLAKPGTTYQEFYANKDKIQQISEYSYDGGRSFLGLEPIRSVDSKRIMVRYDEDGGSDKDGVIELRRGVEDISLGNARYAQVRIGVDGNKYLKGMAMYSDDMPDGVDIIFNTNKSKNTPKMETFKDMKKLPDGTIDPDNPFGATVKQRKYINKKGQEELSALNIVNEEGDWSNWSKSLSSQMLSKQKKEVAKKQLGIALDIRMEELNEIMKLTNPNIRKKLLETFAEDADAAAVHLKAAALPRQGSHVILPFPKMKENEIYAPNYENGERVALVRYPHGGTFEIPELIVNNKYGPAKSVIKNAKDAVGINPKVAQRLSGADFDGDTVLVIPNKNKQIKSTSPLKGLKDFDPKISYPAYEGMKRMSATLKQKKMGDVSNLITDMTIKGANEYEIAKAVRHSMVVIDAEKHNLNYKQSYIDNGIAGLKEKYQGKANAGASTLISRASSDKRVAARKEKGIDPKTGKKIYEETGETYVNAKGKTVTKTIKSTKMAEVDDAYKLSSGTAMESIYADYANKLKAAANNARKESVAIKPTKVNKEAKEIYKTEVESLKASLNLALKNKPLERQAQLLANTIVASKKKENPDMDKDDLKKIKTQALNEARLRTGAKKQPITINEREWMAIQEGAVSANIQTQIFNNMDSEALKQLATPRTKTTISSSKASKAKAMASNGYTQAEIAQALGVSTSTVSDIIN